MPHSPLRLAMWSGPRNISTAMMRSWGNRPDTVVCDEPLYAHYLRVTLRAHPGADEVIARHDGDWRSVVRRLLGPLPAGKTVFYQKHMAHHLLPHIERGWLDELTHCFLIRDPAEVLISYAKKADEPTLADTGFPQQVELFEQVRVRTGRPPPVVDARDVLLDPRRILGLLCEAVGIEFSESMLAWPPGLRDTDGVWARHWYHEAATSTTFRPYRPRHESVPPDLAEVLQQCRACYEQLYPHRLT